MKEIILVKIEKWLLKLVFIKKVEGINICDYRDKDDGYEEIITSSINLIKSIDPRRYKTVKNEISWIINTNEPGKYGGRYRRRIKGCLINFENYSEDRRLVSAFYAGLIIHEATHGLLYTKGMRYTEENRVQIERICNAEENRFYQKIENIYPEYQGYLVYEFNPQDWDYSWNTSKWKQAFHALRRVMRD